MRKTPTFGEAVAAWFRAVNRSPDGKRVVNLNALSDRTGVARSTLYRIEGGDGADEETLQAIARALGVQEPRIDRVLVTEIPEPATLGEWLDEAGSAIERAKTLVNSADPEPTKPGEAARVVSEYDLNEREAAAAEARAKGGRKRRGKA